MIEECVNGKISRVHTRVGDVPEIVMNMRLHKLVSKVTDLHAFPWLGVGVSD